jgi:hypothetical protein
VILKFLYENVLKDDLHYPILNDKDLKIIRDDEYLMCPKYNGVRTWIIFFKKNNIYYGVNFPKHSQEKRKELQIFPVESAVHKKLYRGTIMEGTYFRIDNIKYIYIDEIYLLAGEMQLSKNKSDRLKIIKDTLYDCVEKKPSFKFFVVPHYQVGKNEIINFYNKIKNDNKIHSILFFPELYGKRIFQYVIVDDDKTDDIDYISRFYMKNTDKPDVFELYTIENEKYGIAYIPNTETSKMCESWFPKKKKILVNCKLNLMKNKWVPFEVLDER